MRDWQAGSWLQLFSWGGGGSSCRGDDLQVAHPRKESVHSQVCCVPRAVFKFLHEVLQKKGDKMGRVRTSCADGLQFGSFERSFSIRAASSFEYLHGILAGVSS